MVSPRRIEQAEDRPPPAVDSRGLPVDIGDAQTVEITHDVNNLLTAVFGHAQVALSDPHLSPSTRSDLLEVVRAARQAALLTRQLLTLSRPTASLRSTVDLRTVVGAMGRMLWPLIGDDVELRTESGSRPIRVDADPADLEGIILNLAINARDAMPTGGVLTLGTAVVSGVGGRRAALSVSDTGVGMDPATRARAFEPYFTTKGPGRGSGLGLASVAATARRNGWALRVDFGARRGQPVHCRDPARTAKRDVRLSRAAGVAAAQPSDLGSSPRSRPTLS